MSKKKKDSGEGKASAEDLESTDSPTPAPAAPAKKEPCVSLVELIAMRKIPDHHALAMKLYAGDDGEKPLSKWMDLYQEMMSKPSDMAKEKWHEEFKNRKAR